jgi:pimeloyl-ACP methyl ester carboxylesterase
MRTCSLIFLAFLISFTLNAQDEIAILKTVTGNLEGSLSLPGQKTGIPVVLIIAGSGPTDRNGNNEEMQNNSLKLLAEELNKNGIAALRYDKRGVGQSSDVNKDEMEMRPETFVQDVRGWIDLLAEDKRFTKIIVAGHSEGSLFGMLAAIENKKVKGYISIAGAGRPIDVILREQFSNVPANVKEIIYGMLDKLKKGDSLTNVPPILYSVFRPSIQPYMRAWMKYDPQAEIKKLTIPILVIAGTTDIQVKEIDAQLLAKAQPKAELRIIKNMNHVLKDCDTLNKELQMLTYNNPDLPLNKEFSKEFTDFITKNFIAGKPITAPVNKN